MFELMTICFAFVVLYAFGCVSYAAYTLSILKNAQLEHDFSRSQETKLISKKVATSQFDMLKMCWKWPVLVVNDYKKIKSWLA